MLGDNFISEAADFEQPDYAGCMTGTRVDVLSKFVAWIKDDPLSIFWLAGMAGTGKTSIAVSLCRMLRNDPAIVLGGGYFCSRSAGSIARTDVRCILPTLAGILAGQSQEFAQALAAELENDRNLGHKPVGDQIGPLLSRPLATLTSSSRPVVFLIDALDECSNERELAELLRLLADFECDLKVKFILTSRPELHIRGTPISNPEHNTILQLHTISTEEVIADIRLYVSGTLSHATLNATWYTNDDIELLVKLSSGLFIFASTVLKYVLQCEQDEDRQDRLRKATSTIAKRTAATSSIDKIYELILMDASHSDAVDEDELERMKHVLACILTTRASLSVEALAALIGLTPSRLRGSLARLHSLVYLPANNEIPGLRTLHASFGDYLFERGPQQIRIPVTLGHDILARGCMQRLAQNDLCFNVARSKSSFVQNPETAREIALSLIYACLHWAHHIDAASNRTAFDHDVGRTFRSKFLFWLEVFSVTGKVGSASGLLRIAGSVVSDSTRSQMQTLNLLQIALPTVAQFLRDANAFVASSHTAISRSAPHIYISALPFAAKDSLVYQDFSSLCTGIVSVTTYGINRHEGRLVALLTAHGDAVNSVTYSPDGRLLASGSNDSTVRITDTQTGEEAIKPLEGNDGRVFSVAFSPNGLFLISGGEGKVVHVWNALTGRIVLPPLRGHSGWIRSVAYSPHGRLIASGSDDETVRLWNAETGVQVCMITDHTDGINAIAFSPDGSILASASDDNTVRLWNPDTGEAVANPLVDLEDKIVCLGFSPDGKWLAAGSQSSFQVRIWDLGSLEPTPVVITNQGTVAALSFSPDGSIIVSAGRRKIQSWDPRTGRELPGSSFAGHSDYVRSVIFSANGLFLASGSEDHTVRIWDAASGAEAAFEPLPAHSRGVTSIAVSLASTFIASGSFDFSVRVWDTSTGEAKSQPLLGHTDWVFAVAVSPDGRLIASASADHSVRLWDAQTCDLVGDPLLGHDDDVYTVTFSPDAQWVASGSADETMRVWDVATRQVAPFGPLRCKGSVNTVAFSPDGRILAAGDSAGWVHLWWSGTNEQVQPPLLVSSGGIISITFSPDAKRFAFGGSESTVHVWDVVAGHQIFELKGHDQRVWSVAYSPDGLYIVSASEDKSLLLWDAKEGSIIATLFGHSNAVLSVTFTPDGQSIISGGTDNTIHVWDVEGVLSVPAQAERDTFAKLGSALLDADGWLVGSSGELLLWLPADYRGHIQLAPCSMVMGSHRVTLAANEGFNCGDKWTECWRNRG